MASARLPICETGVERVPVAIALQKCARPSRDMIKGRSSIHDRPKDVDARADIGHWCE